MGTVNKEKNLFSGKGGKLAHVFLLLFPDPGLEFYDFLKKYSEFLSDKSNITKL